MAGLERVESSVCRTDSRTTSDAGPDSVYLISVQGRQFSDGRLSFSVGRHISTIECLATLACELVMLLWVILNSYSQIGAPP